MRIYYASLSKAKKSFNLVSLMTLMKDFFLIPHKNGAPSYLPKHLHASLNFPTNSLPGRGEFCHLLLIFANSLDPDQARQNVGPDLDPNCFTLIVFLKEVVEKFNFEKSRQTTKNYEKLPSMQRINLLIAHMLGPVIVPKYLQH